MIDYPVNNDKRLYSLNSLEDRNIICDIAGIFFIILSGVLFVSFISMNAGDTSLLSADVNAHIENILGPFGAYISALSFLLFGSSSYIAAIFCLVLGIYLVVKNESVNIAKSILIFLLIMLSFSILFEIILKQETTHYRGGILGSGIRNLIKIDLVSIIISAIMLMSSILLLLKNTGTIIIKALKSKKVENNLSRKNNLNIKEVLEKNIKKSKTILSKDNYQDIPFISIQTVDEVQNKKFLEIKSFKSAIEDEVNNFDSKTEDYYKEKNIENKPKKNINNIYRDVFKSANKKYSNDVGSALASAVFTDSSSSDDIDDVLESYENNTISKSINPAILDNTVPMTLDELIKKNKLKKSYPKLDNIYSSLNSTEDTITENETTASTEYYNDKPKKLILDYEVETKEDIYTNSTPIENILNDISDNKYEENYYEDEKTNTERDFYNKKDENIFEFDVSRTNKPYNREDHFPTPIKVASSAKVDYVLNSNNDFSNNKIETINHKKENIEDIKNTIEEQVPTITINNSKNKMRIAVVDDIVDNNEEYKKYNNSRYEENENIATYKHSGDYGEEKKEDEYNPLNLASYIEDIETFEDDISNTKENINTAHNIIPTSKRLEDSEYEENTEYMENNLEINSIDIAREIELEREKEREREREKLKAKIHETYIELPKSKNIKKIERSSEEDFIQTNYDSKYIDKHYTKPPLDLLERVIHIDDSSSITAIKQTAIQLENTLLDFGIEAKVTGVSRGPVVTRYELELASGTRVSKIVSLTDNIALALASESVRIIAPIPGRSVVGIEIPNKIRMPVSLREILESADFKSSKKDIPFVLGKGIYGNNVITDLAEAPHLLVAGTTGSGKSVCLSTIILSLLFKLRPDELKFIFIDKKRVELSIYNGIPHLMSPVVSDEKKATVVLRHIVDIMERRYERMEKFFVRNVKAYNEKVRKLLKDGEREFEGEPLELFPYIVVVIDELHNLMVVSSKEVEDLISRLAGMSRAVGIHLIIATQRPSADVVTGVIKANLPTRIAFQVPNKTNSRIIIDMAGAEQLLGKGDGLFCSSGSQMPERVQGAFVSDNEVKKVVDFLSQNIEPVYDEALIAALDKNENDAKDTDEEDILDEELWADAINVVARTRKASASFLQRRLKIGYNRAARIVEIMERQGLVGPENGSKPREVLIDSDYHE